MAVVRIKPVYGEAYATIKRELKRRSAIEADIGHEKTEGDSTGTSTVAYWATKSTL